MPPFLSSILRDSSVLAVGEEFEFLLDAIPTIIFVHEANGETRYANRAWREHTGLTARSINRDEWRQILHPDDLKRVRERWAAAQESLTEFEVEARFRSAEGRYVWFHVRARAMLSSSGQLEGWLGSAADIDAQKRAIERLSSVQRMTVAFETAHTATDVVRTVIAEAIATLGASTGVVYRLDASTELLEAIHFHGFTPETRRGWEQVPLATKAPMCEAVRTRKAIFSSAREDFATNYPAMRSALNRTSSHAWVVAPLVAEGRVIGSLGFGFHTPRTFSTEFEEDVELLSGQCALALDRALKTQSLEQSRRNLETLFNQLPSPVCRAQGPELKVVFANGAFRSLIGSPANMEGRPLRDVVPTPDPFIHAHLEHAMRTGEACTVTEWSTPVNVHDLSDKRQRVLNVLFDPTLNVDGRVDGIIIFATDVTRFVMAREQAEAAEKRLELALQSGRMFSWDWDLATNAMWRSEGHDRLVGIDRNDPSHDDATALLNPIHPEDRDRVLQWSADSVNGVQNGRCEYRVVWPDGSVHWLLTQGEVQKDAGGKPYRMIGCTVDVTEQKETEFALQGAIRARDEQAAIIRTVAQNAASALYLLDERGRPTFQNFAARQITGFSLEDVQQRPLHEVLQMTCPAGDPFPLEREIEPGTTAITPLRDQELLIVREDGTRFPASFSLLPIVRDGELSGAVLEVRDISEQKRTQEALESAIRARDTFFSMCSHELRTPLATLGLSLEVLRRQIDRPGLIVAPDQTPTKQIERLESNVFKLSRLIDDMLDVARVRSGRLKILREECDLGALVQDLLERFAVPFEKARCTVSASLADGVVGNWDPHRVEQVVANLLTNAMRYAPGCEVEISVARVGAAAVLTVRDHGQGIAAEHHEEIFGQFMQVGTSRSTKGLGLGLYIVKQIVELHGGTIGVESRVGEGATFTVTLPLG